MTTPNTPCIVIRYFYPALYHTMKVKPAFFEKKLVSKFDSLLHYNSTSTTVWFDRVGNASIYLVVSSVNF